ncbi:Calmodulin-regulated spectrin-associated protein 1-B [Bagarius yarrelli]|uniref:Calmodulin-regulated spectrin-associated protein 1-B n=1 Tax=Bagarius yarrelli TaxID=175774 RepID=A0A556U5C3_BAGYA|nr:Calmodulin-regulated spectrin-associated protein 1-B [Bagarius yarrelli]
MAKRTEEIERMDLDLDLGAADSSTRRKMESSSEAVEIIPLEMYDSARAKIAANLRWLFAKACGIDHIPDDMRDPFYTDQYEQEHIKPPVIRLLLSSELYCRVLSLILKGDQAASLQSHQSVIQALSRKGIHVMEGDGTPVSEGDLLCQPIKMSSHMPMIDALMMAYTVEMISIEKVVTCVKRFSTFSASKELPFDLQDAMIFWINKVNLKMREIFEKEYKVKQHLLESPSHQKVRYRREHSSGRQIPHFPQLEDLMRDVCDGAALLTVVHYYCPDLMKLDDICLKEVTSIADSLYNIQLLKEFANEYLNKSFYLTLEDMLYSPLVLKHNVMVFIAELFWWFEIVKPEFVRPRDLQELKDARAVSQSKSSRPSVPISNATKRSFLVSPGMTDSAHPVPNSPEVCNRPLSQLNRYILHCATDSDADLASGDSASLTCSISEDSLASTVTPKHQGLPSQGGPRRINGHGLLGTVNMDEDDDMMTVIQEESSKNEGNLSNPGDVDHACGTPDAKTSSKCRQEESPADSRTASFYLEPLMPAVLKPAKEKSICLNKEEESGEGRQRGSARRGGTVEGPSSSARRRPPHNLNRTFNASSLSDLDIASEPKSIESVPPSAGQTSAFKQTVTSSVESSAEQFPGFYLHSSETEDKRPVQAWGEMPVDNTETVETIEDPDTEITKEHHPPKTQCYEEDQESAKLQKDMSVKEHEDKDEGSRCSSPALSVQSQVSSVASGSVRMTSFAERKMQKFGSNQDICSSTSSSQRTTPDGSEIFPFPLTSWRMKRDQSPTQQGKENGSMLASELIKLHMQLKEKRRAIETQKKKMEVLCARQRLKLGKAAFLHVVKPGKSETLPQSFGLDHLKNGQKHNGQKEQSSKDDLCLDALRDREKGTEELEKASLEWESAAAIPPSALDIDEEVDLNECNRYIEMLNESISSIQQQMMQLSLQQDLLIKQNVQSPPGAAPPPIDDRESLPEPKVRAAIHFVEPSGSPVVRKPPKLTSARSRSKPSELKLSKDHSKGQKISTPTSTDSITPRASPRTPKAEPETISQTEARPTNTSFQLHDKANLRTVSREPSSVALGVTFDEGVPSTLRNADDSFEIGPEFDDISKNKANLVEVDLSDIAQSDEASTTVLEVSSDAADGEKKPGMGFFFKDDQKAEDEMAKKRAAFLLKQQKKAEEARVRKQQLEAESELKRDEARRKAEEDRIRKEEEKARRELIKQEYLKRKQQELSEEQEQPKPKPKPKKQRPKSVLKEEISRDLVPKFTPATENLISAQSGSNLSLASVATTEVDSVNSGGAGSQRGESVESFSVLSRTTERDWDNGSTASSITSTSVAEYTGPKLFKEPSAKSNKPIIHNAISHCCLAGKVNEPQKNAILEEIERCESNHLMILFRDGGCQFRALYSFFPDTEEIHKLTGTGPKSITKKMIDKLYKYSSDRKQFTVIPAKTISVSVDALTIHNHLWQVKRPGYPPGLSSLVFFVRNMGEINSTVFNYANLSSVTSLTLTQSGITTIASGAFAQFQNLKSLNLRSNDLSQMSSDWFIHKAVLESLILTNNSITALNENSFAGLVGLLNLNLAQNQIQSITDSFHNLIRLTQLDLSHNRLRQLSMDTLMPLTNTKIFLNGNPWDCSCSVYEFALYLKELQMSSLLQNKMEVLCESPTYQRGRPVWNISKCVNPVTEVALTTENTQTLTPGGTNLTTIISLVVLYHRKQRQKHRLTIKPFPEQQVGTRQGQPDCRTTSEISNKEESISYEQSNSRLLTTLDPTILQSQIHQMYSTEMYQTREWTVRAKSAGPVLSRAAGPERCPHTGVEDPGVWVVKNPAVNTEWKEQSILKLEGNKADPKIEEGKYGSNEEEEQAGNREEIKRKHRHIERGDDDFINTLKTGVGFEQNLMDGNKEEHILEENGQGFLHTEFSVAIGEEYDNDDEEYDLNSNSERFQPPNEHKNGFQPLEDVENMPYLTIGADTENQSPNQKQICTKTSTEQLNLRPIRRTLSWPPTAAQWKKHWAQTQQVLSVSPRFIFLTQYEYHVGMFPSGINSAIPENIPQASCTEFPKQITDLLHVPTVEPSMETSMRFNRFCTQDSSGSTRDYGKVNEGQTEILKSESPIKRTAHPDGTLRQETSSKAANEMKIKSSKRNITNQTSKAEQTRVKTGRQPRRAGRDERKVPKNGQRNQSQSSGSPAQPSGGSPSDDNLLVDNEYTFIDLLHEVVENHGRWTREKWRQSHMNKQKMKNKA